MGLPMRPLLHAIVSFFPAWDAVSGILKSRNLPVDSPVSPGKVCQTRMSGGRTETYTKPSPLEGEWTWVNTQ